MTRAHFEALAAALLNQKPGSNWNPNKRVQWELDCKAVADVCGRSNISFKRDKFLTACGLNDGVVA